MEDDVEVKRQKLIVDQKPIQTGCSAKGLSNEDIGRESGASVEADESFVQNVSFIDFVIVSKLLSNSECYKALNQVFCSNS